MSELKWELTEKEIQKGIANGLSRHTIYSRFYQCGWTVENSITIPSKGHKRLDDSIKELLVKNKIHVETYRNRIKRGWTVEEATTIPPFKTTKNKGDRENGKI